MSDDSNSLESSSVSKGEYVVVARRYRPQAFDQLVGQGQVSQALSNAINTNRVGHAYLFTGARGVGKTSTARILAKCLNCGKGPTPAPCGECDNCLSITSGDDVDVLEIDGASNRGIDEIRQLRSNVNVRPSRSRFKIYIIDEVHMLTTAAFNALLKTLEEPPEHVKFIFCTTDPEKIPITVLSRCQRFDFAPVASDSIVERLRFIVDSENVEAEDAALQLLGRRAGGSMRDSQSLLEQLLSFCGDKITEADVHSMLGTAQGGRLSEIADQLVARDTAAALGEVDRAVREGVDIGQLAEQLLGYFRDMMAAVVGCESELMLHTAAADHGKLKAAGEQFGLETILAIVQILDQTVVRMRQSTQVRTLVEIAIVRICKLEDLETLPTLIAQLQSGAPASTAAPSTRRQAAKPAQKKTEIIPDSPSQAPALARNVEKKLDNSSPAAASSPPQPVENAVSSSPSERAPSVESGSQSSTMPAMSTSSAEKSWRQALAEIGGMTEDFAGNYESLAISAPNQLVVRLKSAYNKDWCERPDVKRKIEQTMAQVTGRDMRIDFAVAEGTVQTKERRQPMQSHRQRMREVEQYPMVQEAMELFDAEVVRLEEGRR